MNDAPSRFESIYSVRFHFAMAAVIGSIFAFFVMGPVPLNPKNIDWLPPDPASQFIGWELFRQDQHVHWPLTFTDRLNYPYGESIALLDVNPPFALALKPFSSLLPQPFQYFGIEVILACVLQLFFALRLFHYLLGRNAAGIFLCSAFFLIAPPLTNRLAGHYTLCNQWLLIAAILLFFSTQGTSPIPTRQVGLAAVGLGSLSVAVHPYLAFPVLLLLITTVLTLVWQHRLTLPLAAGIVSLLALASGLAAYLFGYFIAGGHGYTNAGYRSYSMNLLAPFDPSSWHSVIMPPLHHAADGQYEGYNYLGAGVLFLGLLLLLLPFLTKQRLQILIWRRLLPLIPCCLLLTLMALSTKVTLGSTTLFDLDPHEELSPYLSMLRASGRLFWAPYYLILTVILVGPFLYLRRMWAAMLLTAILMLQVLDTASLSRWVHSTINEQHYTKLKSPIWGTLGKVYQNLIILPPWQCDRLSSPDPSSGYRTFGLLAAREHMRINSYYSGRYTERSHDLQCSEPLATVREHPLSPDSAYVVSPIVASLIADGPTGPGKCHEVDHYILCSNRVDFNRDYALTEVEERVSDGVENSGFEAGVLAPWATFLRVHTGISTAVTHTGNWSLAETDGVGSVYQDAGVPPGRLYTIAAWVAGSPGATTTAQLAVYDPGTKVAIFSSIVHPNPGWQLLSQSIKLTGGALRVHLFRNEGSGTVYWDDIQVYTAK